MYIRSPDLYSLPIITIKRRLTLCLPFKSRGTSSSVDYASNVDIQKYAKCVKTVELLISFQKLQCV